MEWWKDLLRKTHKFKTHLTTAVYQKPMFSPFCIVFRVFSLIYQTSLVKKIYQNSKKMGFIPLY